MGFSTLHEAVRAADRPRPSPRHARTADGYEDPPRFWWRRPGEPEANFRERVELAAGSTPTIFY
jgi:hypothetical protein